MANDVSYIRLDSGLFTAPQVELWGVLIDISERVAKHWTLIGGQMVQLHGLENDQTPPAATTDLDVLADVQANQHSLRQLVLVLNDLGFESAGMSSLGNVAHRYYRGEGPGKLLVDVLAPDKLGQRVDLTTTPPGRTIEVPGGRQAISRTQPVHVKLGTRTGVIYRPSLLGSIIAKASALSIKTAPPDRHYRDLAFLLTLVTDPLALKDQLTASDKKQLRLAQALHDPTHSAWRDLGDEEARLDGQSVYRLLSPAV